MEKPNMENCTDKEWNKWFWSDFNELCKKCINKCKQSHVVELINCKEKNFGETKQD